jgi:hypothetical protein
LNPRRGVDPVADDEALLGRLGRRRLPGHDPDPGRELEIGELRPVGRDGGDELQAGADGSLGVVLLRGRHAPDGHDRVTDELLDDTAVAGDDAAGEVEVAGQELSNLLGVSRFGERCEADEVAEQDRHEPQLSENLPRRGLVAPRPRGGCRDGEVRGGALDAGRGRRRERGAALAAELRYGQDREATARAPASERASALVAELGGRQVLDSAG